MESKRNAEEKKIEREQSFNLSCANLDAELGKTLMETTHKQALILETLKREVNLIEEIGTIEKTKASAYSDEKATRSLAFAYRTLDLGDAR